MNLFIVLVEQKKQRKNTKSKETEDSIYIYIYNIYIYIYQDELDKACFQDDMAYVDFEDLTRIKKNNL